MNEINERIFLSLIQTFYQQTRQIIQPRLCCYASKTNSIKSTVKPHKCGLYIHLIEFIIRLISFVFACNHKAVRTKGYLMKFERYVQ